MFTKTLSFHLLEKYVLIYCNRRKIINILYRYQSEFRYKSLIGFVLVHSNDKILKGFNKVLVTGIILIGLLKKTPVSFFGANKFTSLQVSGYTIKLHKFHKLQKVVLLRCLSKIFQKLFSIPAVSFCSSR